MMDPVKQASELFIEDQFEYAIYLYTNAIQDAKEKTTDKSLEANLYLQRAVCYMKTHKYDHAIKDILEALKKDNTNLTAYKKISKCFLITGDIKQSKQYLINLLNIITDENEKQSVLNEIKVLDEIDQLELKANQEFENENYQKSLELIEQCMKQSEMCLRHKLRKAECYIYLSNFKKATNIINDILFINKYCEEVIFLKGLNQLYQEQYNLGLEDMKLIMKKYKRAKLYYDKYKYVEKCLYDAYNNKNLNQAKDLFLLVLKLDSKNILQKKRMYKELAKILIKEKKYNEAMINITNALIIDENDIESLKIRAETSTEMKDYADAVEDYKKIVTLENNDIHNAWLEEAKDTLIERKINHYQILGVNERCTQTDIIKAWNKLSSNYHPDKLIGKSKAEQIIAKRKYHRIHESYQKLLMLKDTCNNRY